MPGPYLPPKPWLKWELIDTIPEDGETYLAIDSKMHDGFPQVVFFDRGRLHVQDAHISYVKEFFTHWARIPLPQT